MLQTYVADFVQVVNAIFLPFLLGIAFLIFVFNVLRFFIIGGANKESQEKARSLATYSILAFVFILVFWGIVSVLTSSLGLERETAPIPDYLCMNFYGDCGEATP